MKRRLPLVHVLLLFSSGLVLSLAGCWLAVFIGFCVYGPIKLYEPVLWIRWTEIGMFAGAILFAIFSCVAAARGLRRAVRSPFRVLRGTEYRR